MCFENLPIEFDSQGNAHTLSLYFAKSSPNTWDIYAANDGTQVGAVAQRATPKMSAAATTPTAKIAARRPRWSRCSSSARAATTGRR